MCGPECSSAALAKYGLPVVAAPLDQIISLPRVIDGEKTWFSKYPSSNPTLSVSSFTFLASSKLRPSGFSQATPINSPLPDFIAFAISSKVSILAKFGEHTHKAFISGSAIISVMESYAFALSPTPIDFAIKADSSAESLVRDMTPITSQFLTEIND